LALASSKEHICSNAGGTTFASALPATAELMRDEQARTERVSLVGILTSLTLGLAEHIFVTSCF